MTDDAHLAALFAEHRAHLRGVAYRLLGSHSEAEDAVQEAWLRLSRADTSDVANLRGWLTTVVGRICLDVLKSARVSRAAYPGQWLPSYVVEPDAGPAATIPWASTMRAIGWAQRPWAKEGVVSANVAKATQHKKVSIRGPLHLADARRAKFTLAENLDIAPPQPSRR